MSPEEFKNAWQLACEVIEAKNEKIRRLETDLAAFVSQKEAFYAEQSQMRNNPLRGASGEYFFVTHDKRKLCVQVEGGRRITVYERATNHDCAVMQIPQEEWLKS